MTDGLYLFAYQRGIHTVEFRAGRYTQVVVVNVMKAVGGIPQFLLRTIIPRTVYLIGVHSVLEVERGRHVDVVEQGEGGTDGHRMTHAVAPVFDDVGMQ